MATSVLLPADWTMFTRRANNTGRSEVVPVYKNQNPRAEAPFQMVPNDGSRRAPVPCDVGVWRMRGEGHTIGGQTGPSPQLRLELFDQMILPHLDAAYNLARWLTGNRMDAQDVVQESCLRALRFFDGYEGGDPKAWLLSIVRNTSRTWQRQQQRSTESVPFDEAAHTGGGPARNQEQSLVDREQMSMLLRCIETLPVDFREVLILRELEELSYQEIAEVTGLALGTVMSRLSRARKRLEELAAKRNMEALR